ncbi:MAG: hypothetical protein WC342_00600 [Methanoregula sp.]|jgi:hypothetical protein
MELTSGQVREINIAGTGCPTAGNAEGTNSGIAPVSSKEHSTGPALRRNKIVICLGVLAPVTGAAAARPDRGDEPKTSGEDTEADEPDEKEAESPGDLIFSLFERQERIADRINRKIVRLERRLDRIEDEGRN